MLFQITATTSIDNLNKIQIANGVSLRVAVSARSAISPLVEGSFIACIRAMIEARMQIQVDLGFPAGRSIEDRKYAGDDRFVATLPGYFLIAAAREVIDSTGEEIRSRLLKCLWEQISDNHGTILRGPRYSVVSREPDSPIPSILGGGQTFPEATTHFRDVFRRALKQIGGDHKDLSVQQESVISYLYEVAQNSYEHGRHGLDGRIRKGLRGITFERIVFAARDEVLRRKEFPAEIVEYFHREREVSKSNLFYACTVSDLGLGIHNTMPRAGEMPPIDLINRAFLTGEGRKKKEGESAEGAGLPYVYACATQLKALLFVKSAELYALKDFSKQGPEGLTKLNLKGIPIGTAVSIVWPHRKGSEDQLELEQL